MSIKIASMNFGDCDTILHNTPNGVKNIAEVLGPNGEVYWSATKEFTGIPPLSIRSNGTMLLDYLISGNMSQSGTPTPDNPIQPQETGERTGNLFDDFDIVGEVPSVTNGNLVNYTNGACTDLIELTSGLLTLSIYETMVVYVFLYDANKSFLGWVKLSSAGTRTTQQISNYENAKYARVRTDNYSTYLNEKKVMLNLGSTALPYEPYGIKIPISSGDTTTPVYLGEVQTTRKIKKYEFTGQENIALYDQAGLLGFRYLMSAMQNNMRTNGLCTHFIPQITGAVSTRDGITFGANSQYLYFTFSADTISEYSLTDVGSIRSFLRAQYAAGTPVTVWYVLATPTTGIVNEPLRKIGDYADTISYEQAGVQIPTVKGNTVIDVETELKPSQMYIKYK